MFEDEYIFVFADLAIFTSEAKSSINGTLIIQDIPVHLFGYYYLPI